MTVVDCGIRKGGEMCRKVGDGVHEPSEHSGYGQARE